MNDDWNLDRELRRRRRRRRGLLVLLVAMVATTVGAGATSLALFTDSAASTGSFTAGSIDITTDPTVLFEVPGMMPGDSGQATLAVANAGTAVFRYAMRTGTDNAALAAAMTLSISTGSCGSTTGSLYNGGLAAAAIGSNAQGADVGDRTLAGGASENLCFAWTFSSGAADALQGESLEATFTFDAEQTAGNP